MDLVTSTVGTVAVLDVSGRVDSASSPAFEAKLSGLPSGPVVVDFSRVDYVSSAGLRVLLAAAKRSKAAQRGFALCGLKNTVREIFDISGFSTILSIYPDRDSAVKAIGS